MAFTPGPNAAVITVGLNGAQATEREIETIGQALMKLNGLAFQSLNNQVSSLESHIGGLKSKIGEVLALGIAGYSIKSFSAMINGSIEAAAGLHDMSIQTGASVASLMAFRSEAATSETTISDITGAMNKFAKGMAGADEESQGVGQAVKALGLDFDKLKAMSPEKQMLAVAVAMDKFRDGTGKSAVAMTLYGKEGAKMLPFLKDLADDADSVTSKMSAQQVESKKVLAAMADDFGDNITKIKKNMEGWKKELAMGMLPALDDASAAILRVTSRAGGLNDVVKKLAADGSIERWTRAAIDGLTTLGNVLVPGAKMAAAYWALFVAAPAAIAATTAALTPLVHALAVYAMNVAIGQAAAIEWNATLWGTSVAAEVAAGSLTKIGLASKVLFAAFAGWQIGTYLNENFVQARVAGLAFVGAVLTGWENVKYGAEMAWEGVKFAWDKSVNSMKSSFADYLGSVATGLKTVGATDTSKQVQAYADQMRGAVVSQKSFADQTVSLTTAHKKSLEAIDKNIVDLVSYELAADGAAKAVKGAAAAEKEKGGLNFTASSDKATALNKEASEYSSLTAAIKAKIEENYLELATGQAATEGQKLQIKIDEELANGKRKLSDAHRRATQSLLEQLSASEKVLAADRAQRDVTKYVAESTTAREQMSAALDIEYATYGKTADARALAMVALDAETWKEKELAKLREEKKPVTDQMLAQLDAEKQARILVGEATLGQTKALQYATQLAEENKKLAAESISDPRAREQALLQIDAELWRERIRNAGEGTEAQKRLQEQYDIWYANRSKAAVFSVDVSQAAAMLDIMSALDQAAQSAAQGMASAFGSVGQAIGGMTTALTGYERTQAAIAAQLAGSIKDAHGDQAKIERASMMAAEASAQAQIKSYGDMAGAAKGFFDQNSKGYAILSSVEKAYRAAEMVMALESMTKKIFFKETEVAANTALNATKVAGEAAASGASIGLAATESSAWGITAVVKAIASMPFPLNLAAGAATLAAVVGIGAKIVGSVGGGSVSLSEQRQKDQGAGSILGDSKAKSESIAKSLGLVEKNTYQDLAINTSMLASLRNIESNISSFASHLVGSTDITNPKVSLNSNNGFASTVGTLGLAAGGAALGGMAGAGLTAFTSLGAVGGPIGMVIGAVAGAILSKIPAVANLMTSIFGGRQSVTDSGFTMSKASLADILAGGAKASQYADIKTSGGWFGSDHVDPKMTALSADANAQFTLILKSLSDSVQLAASAMGMAGDDFTAKLNGFVVDIGKVSLKDLKGDDLQKALESVFSKVGDDLAQYAVGGLQQLERVGEGYLETLARVATEYQTVDVVFSSFGKAFGQVGLESVAARDHLIELAGGLDKFTSAGDYFLKNFFSEQEQAAALQKRIDPTLAKYGLSTEGASAGKVFRDFIVGLDMTKQGSAEAYTELMAIAPAFKAVTDAQKGALDERKGLQDQLDELTMSSSQLLAKQRAALDGSNVALFDQIQALKDQKAAAEASTAATEAMKSAATSLLGGVDNAFSALQNVVTREKAAVQTTIDAHAAAVTRLQGLSQALHSTLDSYRSDEQKAADRLRAQAEIRSDLAISKAGGSLSDSQIDSLKKALGSVASDSTAHFSSYQDYLRDLYQTQNDIGQLAGITDDSLSVEQQALKAAQEQLSALDAIVSNGQAQLDALKGQSVATLTLAQAIAGLQSSIGAAQGNPIVAATSGIASAYQQLLGRAPDAAGMQFFQDAVGRGATVDSIRAAMMQSDEYKKLHPFAVGTNFVPETMPALIHKGEPIIPAADNRALMARLSSPSESNGVLATAVDRLTKEVEGLRAEARATATHGEKTARLLSRVIRQDKLITTTEDA